IWTMFHSYCFDFSVWEMYGALLYGGTLVIVPNQVARDPSAFLDMLVLERVTVLNQTPSFFYLLLQETRDHSEPDLALRYVIFGGEALDPTRLKSWKQAYPGTKLINMYGITETTVHVTFKEITNTDIQENVSNIGGPIPTTTTYLMDPNLRLLPVGVPGEIYVGGDGVARGYLSRDELTRQKFLQNPYKPEERMYRSGDLAKLLPNGEMVYLGRIDDQVQIRGFRVELGAIQSCLLTHTSVAEAVVVATNLQSSAIEIVAYIVQRADITVTALREHLAQTLPDYMMPSTFVFLEALPLTPNGKVDRRALPVPDGERPDLKETFVAPNTLTEKKLAAIWSEILHVEPVGIHDNFFEIGGHSLLIVQVQRRLCEILGHDVSVVDLFKHPTISSFASFLNQNKIEPSQVNAIEERAQRRKEAIARRKRLSKEDGQIQ
ncbi:MAG TPA: non-ribosomal peptide synthetase, partial [Candidatus Binatia bacterium]